MSLEQCLSPRIFWSSATSDRHLVLGAVPTWLYSQRRHVNGFASIFDIIRSRITTTGSLTSTDPHYLRFEYDVMGNIALSKGDSRQILNRGFQVDVNNPTGLAARNSDETNLTECVDSFKMVHGIAASQEYIKWDWFITFTNNNSQTPGVQFFQHWKRSEAWSSQIPDYDHFSPNEQEECKQAMEECSGPTILRNWVEVRTLVLKWLIERVTFLGGNVAIFSQDEYQKEKGNPFHEHLVFAADRSTLSPEAYELILDMLRTSVFEVIKTDEISSLIERGLLKNMDDFFAKIELAKKFLSHHCGPRCQIRIGIGTGNEDFVCKKPHPVRDSPDPLSHSFIPIKFPYSQSCIDALEKCGLATVVSEYEVEFKHAYFLHRLVT